MKELLKELGLQELAWKQRIIVLYFVLSLCTLCVGDETPIWIIFVLVLNFVNAARLVKKVKIPEID